VVLAEELRDQLARRLRGYRSKNRHFSERRHPVYPV
jgi:hypothetical protein